MTTVELIYDHDCPNVSKARAQLLRAFAEARIPPGWSEWQRDDPAASDYVRSYGSPTILVDGRDVEGVAPSAGISCCRLYADSSGQAQGVPSIQLIVAALRAADQQETPPQRSGRIAGWRSSLATLPGIGASVLPAGLCPACWPAYAGLLSSLGLGFLLKTTYLLPLTALFVLIALGALAFRAKTRKGYGPFAVGLLASGIVLTGKFALALDVAMYGGIALLMVASVWNAWPRTMASSSNDVCPACAPGGRASCSQKPGAKEVS